MAPVRVVLHTHFEDASCFFYPPDYKGVLTAPLVC